jgi:hypothetical protein
MGRNSLLCRTAFARAAHSILAKGLFLNAAVYSCFLERFNRCCLCVSQSRFNATLGENPSTAPGLHQKKFDVLTAHAVTNSCHLFGFAQSAQLRQA